MLCKLISEQTGSRGVLKRYQTRLGTTVEIVETWDQPGAQIIHLFFLPATEVTARPRRRAKTAG
jgi:hypothetical protein